MTPQQRKRSDLRESGEGNILHNYMLLYYTYYTYYTFLFYYTAELPGYSKVEFNPDFQSFPLLNTQRIGILAPEHEIWPYMLILSREIAEHISTNNVVCHVGETSPHPLKCISMTDWLRKAKTSLVDYFQYIFPQHSKDFRT